MCIMDAKNFFLNPQTISQKQYEALRAYYVENKTAKEVAAEFGYKHRGFTSIVLNFNKKLDQDEGILIDSFALPEARDLGIHSYMNGYRLEKLKEKGIKKVYAGVLAENVPALKTQIKYDFKNGEKVTLLKLGRIKKYIKKDGHFK